MAAEEKPVVIRVRRENVVPEEVKAHNEVKKKDIQIIEKTIGDLVEPEHQP